MSGLWGFGVSKRVPLWLLNANYASFVRACLVLAIFGGEATELNERMQEPTPMPETAVAWITTRRIREE